MALLLHLFIMGDMLLLLLLLLLWRRHCRNKARRRRQFWVHPIFSRRASQGEYHNLLQEVRLSNAESHFRYLRMSAKTFDQLLTKVGPLLCRHRYSSLCRPEIHPAERLAITIGYLTTGNSQASLSFKLQIMMIHCVYTCQGNVFSYLASALSGVCQASTFRGRLEGDK